MRRQHLIWLTLGLTLAAFLGATAPAQAAPTSSIVSSTDDSPQQVTLMVHSASMDRIVPITVLTPKNRTRPAPCLLYTSPSPRDD